MKGMRYRLRTLLIVLALGPPLAAAIAYAASFYLREFVIATEWK